MFLPFLLGEERGARGEGRGAGEHSFYSVLSRCQLLDPVRDAATEWYDREEAAKEAAATLANPPVVEILDDEDE